MRVILLHGFCETPSIWSEVEPRFPAHWEIVTPVLPGFDGRPLGSLNSLRDVAQELAGEVEGEGSFLVGHSLGGYVALEMLKQNPEGYSGICLFHSTSRADSAEKKRNRDKTIRFVEDYGKEDFLRNFVSSLVAEQTKTLRPEVVVSMKEMVGTTPTQTILRYSRWMRDRPDSMNFLKGFGGVKIYVLGLLDTFLDFESMVLESEEVEANSMLKLDDAGHLGMREYPGKSAEFLIHQIQSAEGR